MPTMNPPATFSIGEVAREAGVSAPTLRYYERIGLLPAPQRRSGRRVYERAVLERLGVIELAKAAGFSLDEISTLLDGFAPRTRAGTRWQKLAQHKLAELESQAARIERMRVLLEHLSGCSCGELSECVDASRRNERGSVS